MTTNRRIAAMLVALVLLGCKGVQPTSAAVGGDGATAGSGGGTRVEYIKDPTLNNMNAIPVKIPAAWRFQGALLQGGSCGSQPYAVWRATSADGRSVAEMMPTMGWVWGAGPMVGFTPKNGCLPFKGPMSAQQFLKYVASILQVNYVADEPVTAEENAGAQKYWQSLDAIEDARNVKHPKETVELARASVSSSSGTTPMKGSLLAELECTESVTPGMQGLSNYSPGHPVHAVTGPGSTVDQCAVTVAYLMAPENQYADLMRQWGAPGMGMPHGLYTWANGLDPWTLAWSNRSIAGVQAWSDANNQAAAASRQAQQQQFNHSMAMQQQMHEEFLDTMQRGTDRSMLQSQISTNARTTAASDWVDYALDRQTVMDTNTGQTGKISNQVTPGGSLQKVHADGTPIQ